MKNFSLEKSKTFHFTQQKPKVLKIQYQNTKSIESRNLLDEESNKFSYISSKNESRENSINKSGVNLTINEMNDPVKLHLEKKENKFKISAIEKERRKIPNSIFARFKREFNKTFNQTIKETKTSFSYTKRKHRKKKILPFILKDSTNKESETFLTTESNILDKKKEEEILKEKILENQKLLNNKKEESINEKQITFSEPSIIKKKNNSHIRFRYFKKYTKEKNILDKKWKIKYGLYSSSFKPLTSINQNITYQSNSIKDNIRLFLDVFQQYKMYCLSQKIMLSAFRNKELNYQIHINQLLEETSSLLNLIPNILLKDYYEYKERFISNEEPNEDDFKEKNIEDESNCLIENAKLINKVVDFLKPCFNVYIYLVDKDETEMVIPSKQFNLLISIFEKCRVYIGELLLSGKNSMKDLIFDRNLIKKYAPNLIKNFVDNNPEEKIKVNIFEKITQDLKFKQNDEAQKKTRITLALNPEKLIEKKRVNDYREKMAMMTIGGKAGPMSLINSNLMMRMLKYVNKDIREKIISLQTIERYQKQNN